MSQKLSYDFLQTLVGKDIQFLPIIKDLDAYPEAGMGATITGFQCAGDGEYVCHKIYLDYSKFDEYNRRFESSNYFNNEGNPVLTAREVGEYKIKDHIYIDDSVEVPFELFPHVDKTPEFKILDDPKPFLTGPIDGFNDDRVELWILWKGDNNHTKEVVSLKLAEYLGVDLSKIDRQEAPPDDEY